MHHSIQRPGRRGKLAVGHVTGRAPLSQPQPVIFEFLEPPGPPDVHCLDCASEVTGLLGAPACVWGALAVRHSDGCPAYAAMAGERR
jgi:hypothetical protein